LFSLASVAIAAALRPRYAQWVDGGLPMILPAKHRPKTLRPGKYRRQSILLLAAGGFALVFLALVFAPRDASALGRGASRQEAQATDRPGAQQPTIAVPLPKGKKLILTDGTFQVVREYHREGERVRYYSVERSGWEEIPAALVDWAATQKAEAEQEAHQKELTKEIQESEKAARFADLDVDTSFEVRPSVFLPDGVGFYALDENKISVMQQEKAETHLEKGRTAERIITGIPLISQKQDVEIPGKEAKLRIHTADPEFYFRTADKRDPHLTLLRAEVKGDKRALEVISTNLAGQQTYKHSEVSLLQWDAARGLYRFTVDQALAPGEYAVLETTTSEGQSTYVWTFGVDLPGKAAGSPPAKSLGKSKDAGAKRPASH
jgi:hypothetical protein